MTELKKAVFLVASEDAVPIAVSLREAVPDLLAKYNVKIKRKERAK